MLTKIKILFNICVLAILMLFMCGCVNQKIEIKRKSAFSELYSDNKQSEKKDSIIKSGGIIIYRTYEDNENKHINFGPRDINFDLKMNF